jgi:hypothetical protein
VSGSYTCSLGQILKQELVDGKTETILCLLIAYTFAAGFLSYFHHHYSSPEVIKPSK